MRIGMGYDLHRLEKGYDLILGGIEIDFPRGLKGHSDADVLTHALMDALLGAMGKGDIGQHFPDNDQHYHNLSSLTMLDSVLGIMAKTGYSLINADLIVMAQAPKLLPYKSSIIKKLSQQLEVESGRVNLKATTTEKLGVIGQGQAIAAQAVVLIKEGENKC